jgi:hypothetical protein
MRCVAALVDDEVRRIARPAGRELDLEIDAQLWLWSWLLGA